MPAERKLPDKATLKKWLEDEELTRKQVADRVEDLNGGAWRPSLSAISMAAARYGLDPRRNRWDRFLPWRVKAEHQVAKEAILLRKLGRREAGLENDERSDKWLDGWLIELREKDAVVDYYPDTEEGFWYVPRLPADGDGEYDVIRRPEPPGLAGRIRN